jgi:hypothetical protein
MGTTNKRKRALDGPLSSEEFLELMEIEAKKLERFARELREGKWETFAIGGELHSHQGWTLGAGKSHGAGKSYHPPPRVASASLWHRSHRLDRW